MRTLPAPFDLELLASSVVQPALKGGSALRSSSGSGVNGGGSGGGAGGAAGGASGNGNAKDAVTFLSAADQTICLTAIGRAVGFPARIDVAALEAALAATLADLPFLAGR